MSPLRRRRWRPEVPPCREAMGRGTSEAGGGVTGAGRLLPLHGSLCGEWLPSPAIRLGRTLSRAPHLAPRLGCIRRALVIGAEQRAVVLVPRMKARRKVPYPRSGNLSEHPRLPPQVPQQLRPGPRSRHSILAHQLDRALRAVDQEIARDDQHQLRLHLPPPEPPPAPRRVQPCVVGVPLVLDL